MSALSHDTARCMGMSVQHAQLPGDSGADWCPQRETCARYLQRASNTGPRTSYVMWACEPGGFDSKIKEAA